ncbi:MAG: GIY-YIG nuclease family protein [Chloroflexi bacterium]|nr:GIY-YIG nuclease family protein [Chloroflexota bacterium]
MELGTKAKGTYVLLMRLHQPATIAVARLELRLPPGHYAYVGSAMGGLAGRLRHHLTPLSRSHWHIDRLRRYAPVEEVWCAETAAREECAWAGELQCNGGEPVPGFGASDCRCRSHLFRFQAPPSPQEVLPLATRRFVLLGLTPAEAARFLKLGEFPNCSRFDSAEK